VTARLAVWAAIGLVAVFLSWLEMSGATAGRPSSARRIVASRAVRGLIDTPRQELHASAFSASAESRSDDIVQPRASAPGEEMVQDAVSPSGATLGVGKIDIAPAGLDDEVLPRFPGADAPGYTMSPVPGLPGSLATLPEPLEEVSPDDEPLPPLEEELWMHGGSYLYAPEGDRLAWPGHDEHAHYQLLRLPECWQEPRPLTFFADFLGADPIRQYPRLHWPGCEGYAWEPRFVGYGSYEVLGLAFEENNRRQDGLGHQLLVDLDLRLTGTERFHVQFRPLGRGNTGGSFLQLNDPVTYIDNSTAEPDRYWFEGELHSMFSTFLDPFAVRDVHVVAGRFPFVLHNALLMNDDILGLVVNKNTIYFGNLSNLNVQVFYGAKDVDTFRDADARTVGVHASADYKRVLIESTYAFVAHEADSSRDQHFAALSVTRLTGALTTAGRAMFKWGDAGGTGSGQLFVLETNLTRVFSDNFAGVEYGVYYCNAFVATEGWNPISGGNFDRLRSAFEVNPLINISTRGALADTAGVALGVQLFRHHEDESIIPEIAFDVPGGEPVLGFGLRYLIKTGPRSFAQVLGVVNFSDDPRFDREGVFVSETILF